MVIAKYYPSKCNRPVNVVVIRHESKRKVWVRCIDENRYPFYRMSGQSYNSHADGPALKNNLFDLISTRIERRK